MLALYVYAVKNRKGKNKAFLYYILANEGCGTNWMGYRVPYREIPSFSGRKIPRKEEEKNKLVETS